MTRLVLMLAPFGTAIWILAIIGLLYILGLVS